MTAPHDLDRQLTAFLARTDRPARPVVRRGRDPPNDTTTGRSRPVEVPRHAHLRQAGDRTGRCCGPRGRRHQCAHRQPRPRRRPHGVACSVCRGGTLAQPIKQPSGPGDASAPASGVEAPINSGDPAPSSAASSSPPTPTPDPEAVRMAAAAGFQAAGAAHEQAWARLPRTHKDVGRGPSELWGQYLATLRQLQVPADTAADMQDLIRAVSRLQALSGEGGSENRLRSADVRYQTRWDNVWPKLWPAATRVRSDLGLPEPVSHGPDGLGPPYDSFP